MPVYFKCIIRSNSILYKLNCKTPSNNWKITCCCKKRSITFLKILYENSVSTLWKTLISLPICYRRLKVWSCLILKSHKRINIAYNKNAEPYSIRGGQSLCTVTAAFQRATNLTTYGILCLLVIANRALVLGKNEVSSHWIGA